MLQVCGKLHFIISISPEINYLIELGVAGYVEDPNHKDGDNQQKLKLLSECNEFWKTKGQRSSLGLTFPNDNLDFLKSQR